LVNFNRDRIVFNNLCTLNLDSILIIAERKREIILVSIGGNVYRNSISGKKKMRAIVEKDSVYTWGCAV